MSKIKHILSVIHYTICGAVCLQFTHFLCDDWEKIYLCLIIIIKSEVWTITHCLGLGHETMVCAVCLSIFLSNHWGRVMHICASKLTIIGSDDGLSPDRHLAIISISAGILSIGPLGINISEISIEIYTFSFKKIHLKTLSGKWRPFCLGFNVLRKRQRSQWAWA